MKRIDKKPDIGELLSPVGIKKIQEIVILIQNSKEVLSYWNPWDNSKREAARKEKERLKKREKWLLIRYILLWGMMIFITWKCCNLL